MTDAAVVERQTGLRLRPGIGPDQHVKSDPLGAQQGPSRTAGKESPLAIAGLAGYAGTRRAEQALRLGGLVGTGAWRIAWWFRGGARERPESVEAFWQHNMVVVARPGSCGAGRSARPGRGFSQRSWGLRKSCCPSRTLRPQPDRRPVRTPHHGWSGRGA